MHCPRCQWVAVLVVLSCCLPLNIYLHRRQAQLGDSEDLHSADSMVEEAFGKLHSSLGDPGLLKSQAAGQKNPPARASQETAALHHNPNSGPPPAKPGLLKPPPTKAPPAAFRPLITLEPAKGQHSPSHRNPAQSSKRNATAMALSLREQLLGRSRSSHNQALVRAAEMKLVKGADAQKKKEPVGVKAAMKKPLGDLPPPELKSVADEVEAVGMEAHREQSKQTANYHELLESAKGAVSRRGPLNFSVIQGPLVTAHDSCAKSSIHQLPPLPPSPHLTSLICFPSRSRCQKNARAERRPNIMELPLQLSRYVAFEDVFVHQGNFRRVLGRGNFSDVRRPRLITRGSPASALTRDRIAATHLHPPV